MTYMKKIKTSQGHVVIVDDIDYPSVFLYKWQSKKRGKTYYAVRQICIEGKPVEIALHRQILCAQKGQHIDHINHNGLDNRRANLRFCTRSQNMGNMLKQNGSSQYKGVTWKKDSHRWAAQIQCQKQKLHLGYYKREVDAAIAYDQAALNYFGSFAFINFPNQLASLFD